MDDNQISDPIAVIGLACRFPGGANTPDLFWDHLIQGRSSIQEIPKNHWLTSEESPPPSPYGGILDGYDFFTFDAVFFETSTQESIALDPQQRMLLEVVQETLEYAGLPPHQLRGSATGVYIGLCNTDYQSIQFQGPDQQLLDFYSGMGSSPGFAAGRISRFFDFRGPSLTIDTACSSSAVAIHHACQGLRCGDCDLALAGGANALLSSKLHTYLSKLGVLSPSGNSHVFHADSDGYVRAEGCGLIALKRLSDAEREQDRILAVIRGSAVNHDGTASSFTAPNLDSQVQLIQTALKNSHLSSDDIDVIEAHGTGTPLGDVTEMQALSQVFGDRKSSHSKISVGSVKGNLGHLESAAGIAGVIKTILSLQHKKLPLHVCAGELNPMIDWHNSPFTLQDQTREWKTERPRRRAGINSFGLTGTNAHLILEEYPEKHSILLKKEPQPFQLFVISAKTKPALKALIEKYVDYARNTCNQLADICYTAATGRSHFSYRLSFIAHSVRDLLSKMQSRLDDTDWDRLTEANQARPNPEKPIQNIAIDSWMESCKSIPNPDDLFNQIDFHNSRVGIRHSPKDQERVPLKENVLIFLGQCYERGASVDWAGLFDPDHHRKISLPTYSFQRKRYCQDAPFPPPSKANNNSTVQATGTERLPERGECAERIQQYAAQVLDVPARSLKKDRPLSEQGFDSLLGQTLRNFLEDRFHVKLPATFFFNYPTIEAMSNGLASYREPIDTHQETHQETHNPDAMSLISDQDFDLHRLEREVVSVETPFCEEELQRINQLKDEELFSLIEKELSELDERTT